MFPNNKRNGFLNPFLDYFMLEENYDKCGYAKFEQGYNELSASEYKIWNVSQRSKGTM